jgi:hypothetical protein
MMGTRGAVGLSAEASALAMLADLVALLKSADKTLPAAVADLRAAEAGANSARQALDAQQIEHDKRQAEIDARQVELSDHAKDLKAREEDVAAREAENSARQASVTDQAEKNAQSMRELEARPHEIDKMLITARQSIQSEYNKLSLQREACEQEIARALRENDVAMQAARDKAQIEITKQRSLASEAIAIQMESLRQREARVVELEAAIHDRSAKLSEALSRI